MNGLRHPVLFSGKPYDTRNVSTLQNISVCPVCCVLKSCRGDIISQYRSVSLFLMCAPKCALSLSYVCPNVLSLSCMHAQMCSLSLSLVCAPKCSLSLVCAPKCSLSLVCVPKCSLSLVCAPKCSLSLVCAPKCSLSLVCAPKCSLSLVCAPKCSLSLSYAHPNALSLSYARPNVSVCTLKSTEFGTQPYHTVGLSRYHKMSYDTIPAEVSRYQVVSRYHPCSVVSLKLNSTKWIKMNK